MLSIKTTAITITATAKIETQNFSASFINSMVGNEWSVEKRTAPTTPSPYLNPKLKVLVCTASAPLPYSYLFLKHSRVKL